MKKEINGYVFNKCITDNQIEWLKENYYLKLEEICYYLKISNETVYRYLKALEIKRERLRKISIPHDKEAKDLLMNPYISHVKIADKYNCTPEAVSKRRQLLGVGVRRNMSMNRLEEKIKTILDEFDYVYFYEKRISTFSIDFYLGQKTCIDVHGEWSHSKPRQIEIDNRKTKHLKSEGYKYLVIHEEEIDNAKQLIQSFISGFPLLEMTSKKLGERVASGVV